MSQSLVGTMHGSELGRGALLIAILLGSVLGFLATDPDVTLPFVYGPPLQTTPNASTAEPQFMGRPHYFCLLMSPVKKHSFNPLFVNKSPSLPEGNTSFRDNPAHLRVSSLCTLNPSQKF